MEALEYQMSRNLEVLRQRRERTKFSGTFRGKLYNFGGRLFALYCVARVLSVNLFSASSSSLDMRLTFYVWQSLVNVVLPAKSSASRSSYPDLLTDLLASLVAFLSPSNAYRFEDIALFARQISLVLVGIIILTSIRLVLRGVTRVGPSHSFGPRVMDP